MKKILLLLFIMICTVTTNVAEAKVVANEKINIGKVETAQKILLELQKDTATLTENGYGPFVAAIYDENGELVVKTVNTVLNDKCSNSHAEMNAIKEAEKKLNTHDLASYNLSLYVTSEPCIMCLGGIMWSGIKNVYYGVPSNKVEEITGFDEGFKPHWFKEFKKRGIIVYGNIEPEAGEEVLRDYVNSGKTIYKPSR